MKKTRQGVLDLNHIKGPPRGIRLEAPPEQETLCNHKHEDGTSAVSKLGSRGGSRCLECNKTWDWDGKLP